jgi:hypothetical protein
MRREANHGVVAFEGSLNGAAHHVAVVLAGSRKFVEIFGFMFMSNASNHDTTNHTLVLWFVPQITDGACLMALFELRTPRVCISHFEEPESN